MGRHTLKSVKQVRPLLAPTPIEDAKKPDLSKPPAPADLLSRQDKSDLQLLTVKIEKADVQMLALKIQFDQIAAQKNGLIDELNALTIDVLKRYEATESDRIDIIKGTITRIAKEPETPKAAETPAPVEPDQSAAPAAKA